MNKLFKNSLIVFSLFSIHSCGENSSNTESSANLELTYEIDTVMVDPGEGFIYLKRALSASTLSQDQKTLFNFNFDAVELEVIDLEKLQLVDRIPMDAEGPLGVGMPSSLVITEDGNFHFPNFYDLRTFTPQLDSMTMFHLTRQKFEQLDPEESLKPEYLVSKDGKMLFVTYGPEDWEQSNRGLAVLSLQEKSLKKIPLEIFSRLEVFLTSLYQDGNLQMRTIEPVYFHQRDERLLISSSSFNDAYILDLKSDSVSHVVYQSAFTQNSKKVPEKTTFESPEEMRANFRAMNESVNFSPFYFDEKSRRFFRFSRDLDRMIGDSATFKKVVTIFDEDLNQLHEAPFPLDIFGFKFFKDGKLWSFVNLDDELGFEIFTLELN
ncbi:DUF4221 family protein [Algoriphagus marinus]|uniref:DUF4221 family protein n=1 Tax=Algoriphagus marinus TaxID=1925762 RepID=UPI00094BB80E|nr:DUF4221 family protein [Algoriphagus marinus]